MNRPWKPISDYTVGAEDLAQNELRTLQGVWKEQKRRLEKLDAFQRFNERLKREWAIETGLIERLYVLDRGITQLLIDRGINASLIPRNSVSDRDNVASMIRDHEAAVDGIFDFVKGRRKLSTGYIKEIHALMTRSQRTVEAEDPSGRKIEVPLIRGDYKRMPNNPRRPDGEMHEYCPPEHVAAEMDRLIAMHREHAGVSPEVEAAWLHHRFTQIHPFQDGNGRVARALATLVLVKAGWFPLVVRDRERGVYINALEAADDGRLEDLVRHFADIQKDEFIKALSITRDVLRSTRAEDAIRAIRRDLQRRRDALIEEWQAARGVADAFCEGAAKRLQEVAGVMQQEMQGLFENAEFFADSAANDTQRSHYYRRQIVDTARKLDYFANTHTYRSWARLVMKNANRSEMLVAFHGIGHEFQGLLACSACWFQRVETEDGEREIGEVKPLADRVFQINYKEPLEEAKARFFPWLEQCIVQAVELWRTTAL